VWATAVPTADASGYEQIGRAEQGADAHRVKVTFREFGNTARVARNSVSAATRAPRTGIGLDESFPDLLTPADAASHASLRRQM
jgi:hypothetical protein